MFIILKLKKNEYDKKYVEYFIYYKVKIRRYLKMLYLFVHKLIINNVGNKLLTLILLK